MHARVRPPSAARVFLRPNLCDKCTNRTAYAHTHTNQRSCLLVIDIYVQRLSNLYTTLMCDMKNVLAALSALLPSFYLIMYRLAS